MPAPTFIFRTYNKIEEACKRKNTVIIRLLKNSFTPRCSKRPQEPTAFGLSAPQKGADLVREKQSF